MRLAHVVIESDAEALLLEARERIEHRRIGHGGLEHFYHHNLRGKQRRNPVLQEPLGEVDVHRPPAAQAVNTYGDEGIDQECQRRVVRIAAPKHIVQARTKQKLVSRYVKAHIVYGLPRHIDVHIASPISHHNPCAFCSVHRICHYSSFGLPASTPGRPRAPATGPYALRASFFGHPMSVYPGPPKTLSRRA